MKPDNIRNGDDTIGSTESLVGDTGNHNLLPSLDSIIGSISTFARCVEQSLYMS